MFVSPAWGSLPAEQYLLVRPSIEVSQSLVTQAFARLRADICTINRVIGTMSLPCHPQNSAIS